MEIRCAVVGNVDAGKSTLLGVLTHGELDNGRGLARQRLFRHKHEAETGRTRLEYLKISLIFWQPIDNFSLISSVGNDILGFDSAGRVVNKPDHGNLDWVRVCEQSSKVITFIDLAGHEKYLKTTVFGMTGHAPGLYYFQLNFKKMERDDFSKSLNFQTLVCWWLVQTLVSLEWQKNIWVSVVCCNVVYL